MNCCVLSRMGAGPTTNIKTFRMQTITKQSRLSATDTVLVLRACGIKPIAIENFLAQDVTTDLWIDLTHNLLKELGVASFGPRLKLLTWIHVTLVPIEQQDPYRVWAARKVASVWFLPPGVQRMRPRPVAECNLASLFDEKQDNNAQQYCNSERCFHECVGEADFESDTAQSIDRGPIVYAASARDTNAENSTAKDDASKCRDAFLKTRPNFDAVHGHSRSYKSSVHISRYKSSTHDSSVQKSSVHDSSVHDSSVQKSSVQKSGIKVSRADRKMFDVLFSIVCANGATPTKPETLAKLFADKTGKSPDRVFGRDWLTDVKADPRLHYDGHDVIAIQNVRTTPKARNIARYNINALPYAGVDHRILSLIYHLAGLCMPCHDCPEQRGRSCTYCHHPQHNIYSQASFEQRLEQAERRIGSRTMLARRKQVLACLKELNVCHADDLRQIAALLDL